VDRAAPRQPLAGNESLSSATPKARGLALMPLLVDAGILYAMADRSDAWHRPAVNYLETFRPSLLAPVTVLPEAAYLVQTRLGASAERKMVQAFVDGEIAVEPLKPGDLKRVIALMAKYGELGLADCSVVAMAERLQLDTIATTDRRHFTMVRPTHVKRFTLVP